jgi:hypothetical protein
VITQKFLDGHGFVFNLDWSKCRSLTDLFHHRTKKGVTAEDLKEYILQTFGHSESGSKDLLQRIALTGRVSYVPFAYYKKDGEDRARVSRSHEIPEPRRP